MEETEDTEALLSDVQEMQRLVDEFLAFARGDAQEEPSLVDPAQLVADIVAKTQRGGQDVALGACHGQGRLRIRPQAVTRALDNLLGNALRYGTKARLSYHLTDRSLRLVVEDNGPGIPAKAVRHLFEPFYRARSDLTEGVSGTGIGLTISRELAQLHGGSLTVCPNYRDGARFILTLPNKS